MINDLHDLVKRALGVSDLQNGYLRLENLYSTLLICFHDNHVARGYIFDLYVISISSAFGSSSISGAMGKRRKRKAIPAALHSEISEYASLLRVLRATDTLDIATHLTRLDSPHETVQATHEEPGQRGSLTPSHVETPVDEETSRPSPEGDAVHPGRSWKNWTRWPLVPEDVHLPEWGFEDEVYSLAKQVLLSDVSYLDSRDANSEDSNVLIEDQAEVLLPPSSLRALADVSSSHLERILSSLASYSLSAEESSHGRSHPLGWESVLNVVGTAGLVDGT